MKRTWRYCVLSACSLCVLLAGCVLGPEAVRVSRARYNEVLQRTTNEQLLLNLVRLQYRDAPSFLEIGSVAAQFRFEQSATIGGRLNENIPAQPLNPDWLDLGGRVGYTEQPTVTFVPLQGDDFVNRLLSPLRLDTVVLLTRSGWRIDRVFHLMLQGINGLDNAAGASGPTPSAAPRYERFARVAAAFRRLQQNGLLELGYEAQPTELSAPLPAEQVLAADVVLAARDGNRFQPTDDGRTVVLTGTTNVLVWRIPAEAGDGEDVAEIVDLLGLRPAQQRYEVRETAGVVASRQPAGKREHIAVATRSLMGTMFYLSQSVIVPRAHREAGVVTTTLDAKGEPFDWARVVGELLRVRSQSAAPSAATVTVRYRGHWFYIADADLQSKSTFGLLIQLFALQAGTESRAAPVLTLPVGG